MSAATLLRKLKRVRPVAPDRWLATCPAHEVRAPTLSVCVVDGAVLLRCLAGCDTGRILAAVGLEPADLKGERQMDLMAGLHE